MINTVHVMPKIAILMLCTVILWALAIVGCNTLIGANFVKKYNQNPLTVTIPQDLPPEKVEQVIVETLRQRQWRVVQQSPEEVVGQLDHR